MEGTLDNCETRFEETTSDVEMEGRTAVNEDDVTGGGNDGEGPAYFLLCRLMMNELIVG